jgi:hypothetical protein
VARGGLPSSVFSKVALDGEDVDRVDPLNVEAEVLTMRR